MVSPVKNLLLKNIGIAIRQGFAKASASASENLIGCWFTGLKERNSNSFSSVPAAIPISFKTTAWMF